MSITIQVELSGGLELLFNNEKNHTVEIPEGSTLQQLLFYVRDNLLRERPEMFLDGSTVRAGVLVLINDTDWELCEKETTVLENKDNVTFISTLHGG